MLEGRGVITDDIERVEGGETFFWQGHYEYDMNVAHTDDTQLNVFADFDPKLSDAAGQAQMLFLGNIQPELQRSVRARCGEAEFAALDSMNLWIETARDSLKSAIAEVDCLLLNDAEIRELTGEPNLARAARAPRWRWARRSWSRSAASTGPPSSAAMSSSRSPASCSRTSATRPAPATPSPAASSATWTTAGRPGTPRSTTMSCARGWPTARCSPRSTSRTSARSGSGH